MDKRITQKVAQQIVDTVKDVCGQDINFIDSNGYIFASTNAKRINDYHEIGKHVVEQGASIEVEADDSFLGTQKGVNIPFQYNGEIIAVIGITGKPEEVRKYAYLAQKITSLILREHELDAQNHNQRDQLNYVIHSLITNEHINSLYFSDFLKQYELSADRNYQTILVALDSRYNPSNLSLVEQKIFQLFETTGSKLYSFQYPNEYLLLLESKHLPKWTYLLEKLAKEYSGLIKIGVGNSDTLLKQHHSYEAAQIAIHSLNSLKNIAFFDELDLEILLGRISSDSKELFLVKTIAPLSEDDLELLRTYFDCDMSLKNTCEKLFLHKNTLQYKLDRIWHLCGYNPRSFRDAAVLYMALKLI